MSARVRFLAGGITGGHIGPPLHGVGSVWEPTGIGAERCLSRRGGTEPAPYGGSGGVRGGVWSPRPTGATQVVRSSGPMYLRHGFRRPNFVPKFGRRQSWASAPTGRRGSLSKHPGQRRTAERLRQRVRGNEWELRQRSSPKGPATSDNPSVSLRLTAPFTQGSLGDGGFGLPRRPCRTPRNDNGFLSFRGAKRLGNPSFFTMDDGRGFGLPHERRGERHAESSCPTESPINHPSQPARSEASAPAAARDGRESTQGPSQKGDRPATSRAALSEAESAERGAGQIRFLPDDLRVQHGVQRSEVSAKPRPCSRRSYVN